MSKGTLARMRPVAVTAIAGWEPGGIRGRVPRGSVGSRANGRRRPTGWAAPRRPLDSTADILIDGETSAASVVSINSNGTVNASSR